MDCTKCSSKGCRRLEPCNDNSEEYIENYWSSENIEYIRKASMLVDNGRAGTLNRLEEIIEYCKAGSIVKVGVAYCYGMEKDAIKLRNYLANEGFEPIVVSCTVDGISESRINKNKQKQVVSCNPLGQAYFLNGSGAQFVIVMGLCLGHDILFQKEIKIDFTTFVVKDRALMHNPILALNDGKFVEDVFLEKLEENYNLIKDEELYENLKSAEYLENSYLIDLRNEKEYIAEHIKGSINLNLKQLPNAYKNLLPNKNREIIIYCDEGVQAGYAVMYLSLKGYKRVKSLYGGYSLYKKYIRSKNEE